MDCDVGKGDTPIPVVVVYRFPSKDSVLLLNTASLFAFSSKKVMRFPTCFPTGEVYHRGLSPRMVVSGCSRGYRMDCAKSVLAQEWPEGKRGWSLRCDHLIRSNISKPALRG